MRNEGSETRKPRRSVAEWNGQRVAPGDSADIELKVSEGYSGVPIKIPLHVRRSSMNGPAIFITAALHGDELNGTGAIRSLILDDSFQPTMGSVVLVPVLNVLGFDRHSRYLPDRRDLNRTFPGWAKGSLAARLAHTIFEEIVSRSDYGIDLHTAATRRTNFPTVRADMSNPEVRNLAESFGGEVIVDGKGPKGSLRRAAGEAGCPTIVFEAGEVWKVEPSIVDYTLRGVLNVLANLGMSKRKPERAERNIVVGESKWIRAERGGFLQFHIAPGDIVERGQELATNTSLLGREQNLLVAPFDGIVIGMTTLPAVSPGEAVCHLGRLRGKKAKEVRGFRKGLPQRIVEDLATNVLVVKPARRPEG